VRRLLSAVLTAGLAAGLVGCGIPDETAVRVEGPGPSPGNVPGEPIPQPAPPRSPTYSAEEFVTNFLRAPAGDMGTMKARLDGYVAEAFRGQVKPSTEVSVVRLIGGPRFATSDPAEATLNVEHVGTLTAAGELKPPTETETTYTMRVGPVADSDGGLWVLRTPLTTLMTVDALQTYYEARPIYFWNTEYSALVPDLRYLPQDTQDAYRPTKLLDWLAQGPATALDGVAQRLPEDSRPAANSPLNTETQTLTVSWTAVPDAQQRDRLVDQIVWSLQDTGFTHIILRSGNESFPYQNAADRVRPAYPISDSPQRYAIDGGVVRRLSGSAGPAPPSPLSTELNHDIVSAAFTRDRPVRAAVVKTNADGERVLQVGEGQQTVTALRSVPSLRPSSRPVWLPRPDGVGLVAAGGGLYKFEANGGASRLTLTGVEGSVTAVAVSPDGSRLGVIAGGRLYIVPVAGAGPAVQPQRARLLNTSLSRLTAVAWSQENRLVVAGDRATGRTELVDVTADGGIENPRVTDAGGRVEVIATYPDNLVSSAPAQPVMYEAASLAFRAGSPPDQIGRDEIGDLPEPSPPPTGSLTSPFYVY
jgi:hypothetical protein